MEKDTKENYEEIKKLSEASLRYRKIAILLSLVTVFVSLWYMTRVHTGDPFLILQLVLYVIFIYGVYKNRSVAVIGLIILTTVVTGLKFLILKNVLVIPAVLWYLVVWNLYKSLMINKIIKNK